MAREFKLPDLGEGIAEGQIVRILCKEGETITEDQAIMEVETDKAAVEIPSPFGGVAKTIHVKEGETVAVGQVLVTFDGGNGSAAAGAATQKAAANSAAAHATEAPTASATAVMPPPAAPPAPVAAVSGAKRTRAAAAPAVRKFAREQGVDIDTLAGSGPGGRVVRGDIEAALSRPSPAASTAGAPAAAAPSGPPPVLSVVAPPPVIEGAPGKDSWGSVKRQPLTQIRKTIAKAMTRSRTIIPEVVHTDDADVTELEHIRRDLRGPDGNGPRVTLMSFVIKTLAHCLRQYPMFNASFDDEREEIVYKEYINIGIAVDSPRGLVVPVLRNVDQLSVLGIAHELRALADKVRNVNFTVDDLRGGTFTVTNYGAIGGIYGSPVINHPDVGILGLGRVVKKPVVMADDEIAVRSILPLSLSFDHRAADGAQAGRFVNDIMAHLAKPSLLLIKG